MTGLAYLQIRPYIRLGIPQVSDFEQILEILEKAFGDPNRASYATRKLHELRQTNREFNEFYAEFQRLALDSKIDEMSLVPILERAISRELKQLLVASRPPANDIHSLANHLQDLDTRNRYLFGTLPNHPILSQNTRTLPVTKTIVHQPVPYAPPPRQRDTEGEPMDLSNTRRRPDKETGNCFRCHQPGHRIRDCQQPDTRPQSVQRRDSETRRYRVNNMNARSPSPPQSPSNRFSVLQPTPVRIPTPAFAPYQITGSENGTRLG